MWVGGVWLRAIGIEVGRVYHMNVCVCYVLGAVQLFTYRFPGMPAKSCHTI